MARGAGSRLRRPPDTHRTDSGHERGAHTRMSEAPRDKQNDDNDQDDADETVAAVSIAVAGATETATEATKQEDDEDNDEDSSQRHDRVPLQDIRVWLLSLSR